MYKTNRLVQQSLRKLATGTRIGRPEDDAASFSIAAKVSARVSGLNQALSNTSDVKSLLDVAEGNLASIVDILRRVKQLVLQAANATPGTDERAFVRNTVNGLAREIDSIVDQAVFNGRNILDGSYSATYQVGERIDDTLELALPLNLRPQDVQVEEVSTFGRLTLAGALTAATNLNAFNEIENIQAGDAFNITLTRGDGTTENVLFTTTGIKGQLTTSTVGDIINAINSTGDFLASIDNDTNSLVVREVVPTVGNALMVTFSSFNEFPGVDGITASMPLARRASDGALQSSLTGPGVITAGTQLNTLDQFSDLEGQDIVRLTLRDRSGLDHIVDVTMAGAAGAATTSTLGNVRDAINAQVGLKWLASIAGNQLVVQELDIQRFSFNLTGTFSENNLNAGVANVTAAGFSQRTDRVRLNTVTGIAGGSSLNNADPLLGIGDGFDVGDTFDINITLNDGSNYQLTYTFASAADTFSDLLNYINTNADLNGDTQNDISASIVGGRLVIQETTGDSGTSFNMSFSGSAFLTNTTFQQNRIALSLGSFDALPPIGGAGVLLNDLSQFQNVQSGDTVVINVTNAIGVTTGYTFTFAGPAAGTSTSTVGDLASFLNVQAGISAAYDEAVDAIVVTDTVNFGNTMAVSFGAFTEASKLNATAPNPVFTFSTYANEAIQSNVLVNKNTLLTATAATRITDLVGFDNIEGGDTISFQYRNRNNNLLNFTYTFDDVGAGITSNRTVADIVSSINGRVVNGVVMQASFNAGTGRIEISEQNPLARAGFGGSSSGIEHNINIPSAVFPAFDFEISQFLPVSNDTGLVFGLGLLDFESGTFLTQSVASRLIRNVDDSIDRIINQLNTVGNLQLRLSNREVGISKSIISNSAALSRLRDTDFAKETSTLIRLTIQQQFQIAALSQANLVPASILRFL